MSKKASSITSTNSDSNALNGFKKRQCHLICKWLPFSSFHHQFLERPQIPQERYGWDFLPQIEGTTGNEIGVSIWLPTFRSLGGVDHRATNVQATIRGHMPLAKASVLEEQL